MADGGALVSLIRRFSAPLLPRILDPGTLVVLRDLNSEGDPRPPVRALVFDVYGTLFVSGSGDIGVLGDGGGEDGSTEERTKALLGKFASPEELPGLKTAFVAAVKERHAEQGKNVEIPEVRVEEIWKGILGLDSDEDAAEFSLRFELAVNPVYPMPGLEETLARCSAAGVPMGIVSNAQFFTPLLFEAFLGRGTRELGFRDDLCVYSFREGEAKPSPKLFARIRAALRSRGTEPEDALYIGNDMLNDVWAAKSAGLRTALFAGDLRSLRLRREDPRCVGLRPDRVVMSLDEIP